MSDIVSSSTPSSELVHSTTGEVVRIVSLEIRNFKSLERVNLCNLEQFKLFALIGLNGSGKSNIIDAILYVLGEANLRQLRIRRFSDLVRQTNAHFEIECCTVKITLTINDETITFTRSSTLNGATLYEVGDKRVSTQSYVNALAKLGFDTRTKNFVVMQESIHKIAVMREKQLTELIESTCGSIAFKREYDECVERLAEHRRNLELATSDLREAELNLARANKAKRVLEKINALKKQLEELHIQRYLCHIYHLNKQLDVRKIELEMKQRYCQDLQTQLEQINENLQNNENLNTINENLRTQLATLESIKSELHQARIGVITAKDEWVFNTRRRESSSLKLPALKAALQKKMTELEVNVKKREEITKEIEAIERVEHFEISSQGVEEYRRISCEVRQILSQDEDVQETTMADEIKLQLLETSNVKLTNEIASKQKDYERYTNDAAIMQSKIAALKTQLRSLNANKTRDDENIAQLRSEIEDIHRELQEISEALQYAQGDDPDQTKTKKDAILDKLQSLYPGVHGRLSDLFSIKTEHNNCLTAIQRVFDRNLDAIVVDNVKTALNCGRLLQREALSREMFIPLKTIKYRNDSVALASIPSAILMKEVLQYNKDIEPAILFACDNTVILPTRAEAQVISRDLGRPINAVALDGTLYTKSGLVIGGSVRSTRRPLPPSKVAKFKELQETLRSKLMAKQDGRTKMECTIIQLGLQIDVCKEQFRSSLNEGETIQKMANEFKKKLEELAENRTAILTQINQYKLQKDRRQARIELIEQEKYADFCTRYNLENIQQYERGMLPQIELQHQKLNNYTVQLEDIKHAITNLESTVKKDEEAIEKLNSAIENLKSKEPSLREKLTDAQTKEKHIAEKLKQEEERKNELDKLLQQKRKEKEALRKNFAKLKTQISQITDLISQLSSELASYMHERHKCFLDCKLQNITLPVTSGDFAELVRESSDSSSLEETFTLGSLITLDYTSLESRYTELQFVDLQQTLDSFNEMTNQLIVKINALGKVNLRAHELAADLQRKCTTARHQSKQEKSNYDAAIKVFDGVKQKRLACFQDCIQHIQAAVNSIYKALYGQSNGEATFVPINKEEPYLDGMHYVCKVPNKRAVAMKLLSGGEKSMASLALLYALRSYKPLPIFLLDEVDCQLDPTNSINLATFLRQNHLGNKQTFVVSHNVHTASHSDIVFGLCKQQGTIKIVRVNLTEIDLE